MTKKKKIKNIKTAPNNLFRNLQIAKEKNKQMV